MPNARVHSLTTLGLGVVIVAAATTLPGGSARADDRRPVPALTGVPGDAPRREAMPPIEPTAEGPLVATGDLDESAWDIPGEIVVDAKDNLDEGSLLSLARDYGLHFSPTALEAETKEELADVPSGKMAEIVSRLSRDPRVEIVEPLARVQAFFTANDPLLKEQWHMERVG